MGARLLPLALALAVLTARGALAVDCTPASVLCVPEESALADAFQNVAHGGTIDVAPGTYTAPSSPAPGGFRLGTDKNRSFTVRARNGLGSVTLTGGNATPVVVLDTLAAGRWITFEGLRFVNGRSTVANFAGGATVKNARATFSECEFVGNLAATGAIGGGGLGLFGGATALVERALFENNRALGEGGAIFAQKGAAPYDSPSTLWVLGTTFRANCETGTISSCASNDGNGAGGAILVRNSTLRVADSLFENNTAGWVGGAIYGYGSFSCTTPYCAAPAADLLVVRSRFSGNSAANTALAAATQAGAIHVEYCARLRLFHSILEDNRAESAGAVQGFLATVEIYDSVLRGNRATWTAGLGAGGAVGVQSSPDAACAGQNLPAAVLRIERSLVEGGSAGAQEAQLGGCIYAAGDATNAGSGSCQSGQGARCAQVTILNSAIFDCAVARQFAGSTAVSGGGFFLQRAHATMSDVLVARNLATGAATGVCPAGGAGVVSQDARLVMTDVLYSGNQAACGADDLHLATGGTISEANVRYYTATSAAPPDAKLLGLPPRFAADTALTIGESWLAYGWSGSAARLDGVALGTNPRNGLEPAGDALHVLDVQNGTRTDSADVSADAAPVTSLVAAATCPPAGSTTLAWETPSGSFLAALIDQGVAGGTASGSTGVTPPGSVTYRRAALTQQGGAYDEARVYVAGCPDRLFADGFESGGTSMWSSTTP